MVDSSGPVDPVGAQQVGLAELLADLAPDVVLQVIAAVEGGDASGAEVQPLGEVGGQDARAQMRVFRQKTEGHHEVRLTTAHGLRQLECGLVGAAGQPQQTLAKEGVHALGDIVASEELCPVAFAADQIR